MLWFCWLALARFEILNTEWIRWGISFLLGGIALVMQRKEKLPPKLSLFFFAITLMALMGVVLADSFLYAFFRFGAFLLMILWSLVAIPSLILDQKITIRDIYRFFLWYSVAAMFFLWWYGGWPSSFLLGSERYNCGYVLVATGVANVSMLALPFFVFAWRESKGIKAKIFWLLMLSFCIAALIASKGRGSISTVILLLPLLFMIAGIKTYLQVFVILCGIGAICVALIPEDMIVTTLRLDAKDLTSYRADMFDLLWNEGINHHPLFGAGTGMDRVFLENYIITTGEDSFYTNPHNQFISVFFNWGWCGVIVFYSFALYVCTCGYRLARACRQSEDKLPIVFVYFFVSLVIESMNSGGLDTAGNGTSYLFWAFGGILIVISSKKPEIAAAPLPLKSGVGI